MTKQPSKKKIEKAYDDDGEAHGGQEEHDLGVASYLALAAGQQCLKYKCLLKLGFVTRT